MSEFKTGIFVETGGDLAKDRTLFRFGKRVEAVLLTNGSTTARLFDVQVAREPQFYLPGGSGGLTRNVLTQETYFYVKLLAGTTFSSPPFFARRGLRVRAQTANCYATAVVYGVEEGDCTYKDPNV